MIHLGPDPTAPSNKQTYAAPARPTQEEALASVLALLRLEHPRGVHLGPEEADALSLHLGLRARRKPAAEDVGRPRGWKKVREQ